MFPINHEHAPIRVLVVDDQPSMRALISHALRQQGDIEIVAEAGNAREARDAVVGLHPAVITLDVEMPGLDGIEFLERLMRARPTPVVMVSSRTHCGSEAAIRALAHGAVACMAKPRATGASLGAEWDELRKLVRIAARAKVSGRRFDNGAFPAKPQTPNRWNRKIVLIGASTGGVEAIERVLSTFPADCPPTLITQHMPAGFLASFAARLDRHVAPAVRLARDMDHPARGEVLLAPGGRAHMRLDTSAAVPRVQLDEAPPVSGHRPSVDVLFTSALPVARNCVSILLTGMGKDGARGMRALRDAGARTIVQDQESAVIWGMPGAASRLGAAEQTLPLGEIGPAVLTLCSATEFGAEQPRHPSGPA